MGRVGRYFAIAAGGVARLEMKQELADRALGADGADRRASGNRTSVRQTARRAAGTMRLWGNTDLAAWGRRVEQRMNGVNDERGVQNRHQRRRERQPARYLAHGIRGLSPSSSV
jgi:hypothetical protein